MKKKLILIFLILCTLPLFSEIKFQDKEILDKWNEAESFTHSPAYRILWCFCDTKEDVLLLLNIEDFEQYYFNTETLSTKNEETCYVITADFFTIHEFTLVRIDYYEKDRNVVNSYQYWIEPDYIKKLR